MRHLRRLAMTLLILALLVAVIPLLVPVQPYQGLSPEQAAQPDSRFLNVRGVRFHYKQYGSGGPLILLLHGFGSSTYSWEKVAPQLTALGTVVSFDRPGFGLTERLLEPQWPGLDPYDAQEQAGFVIALMRALGYERAVLVGNSAGGAIALDTALRYPDAVQGLVLVSPALDNLGRHSPFVEWVFSTPQVRHLGPLLMRLLAPRLQKAIPLAWHDQSLVTPAIVAANRAPLLLTNWDAALWYVTTAPHVLELWSRVADVSTPTLILHGENDLIVPVESSRKLARLNARMTLIPLADMGHVPQEEAPDRFLNAVVPWLASTLPVQP
jgi:pimeloyl-ACP methyl ester carboxylesterase